MATGIRASPTFVIVVALAATVGGLAILAAAQSPDTRGVAAYSWRPSALTRRASTRTRNNLRHRPAVAPLYSTLLQIGPLQLPELSATWRANGRSRRTGSLHVQIRQDIRSTTARR